MPLQIYGSHTRGQRFATKNTLDPTGSQIMIGKDAVVLSRTIAHSWIFLFMLWHNFHALLPRMRLSISLELAQLQLLLNACFYIVLQVTAKNRFKSKLLKDKSFVRRTPNMIHSLFTLRVVQAMDNTSLSLKRVPS